MGHRAAPDGCHRALRRGPDHRAFPQEALMDQLKHLIEVWTSYAQGLTGSIGALAFVCAFIWMRADDRDTWTNSSSSLNRASGRPSWPPRRKQLREQWKLG